MAQSRVISSDEGGGAAAVKGMVSFNPAPAREEDVVIPAFSDQDAEAQVTQVSGRGPRVIKCSGLAHVTLLPQPKHARQPGQVR